MISLLMVTRSTDDRLLSSVALSLLDHSPRNAITVTLSLRALPLKSLTSSMMACTSASAGRGLVDSQRVNQPVVAEFAAAHRIQQRLG